MDKIIARQYEGQFKDMEVEGYRIEQLIGYGKSAAVFLAKDNHMNNVAIKIFDIDIVNRFGEDAQKERLSHELNLKGHKIDNLIKILGGGTFDHNGSNYFYIIMEYVDGVNLKEYITSNREQDIEFAKNLFSVLYKVTEDLMKLHIAHRDIKPENIMITNDNRIIIMDLGVLKLIDDPSVTDLFGNKPFIGTLRYAPPEFLIREEENSPEAWRAINLYQIGGVLHDVIMGHELFSQYSEPYAKLVLAIQNETPSIRRVDYNPRFCQFVRNLLNKDWKQRLKLFEDVDLKVLFNEGTNSNLDIGLESIRKMTDRYSEKLKEISIKKQNEEEKKARMISVFTSIQNNIHLVLEEMHKEGAFTRSELLIKEQDRYNTNDFMLIYEITGTLEQGFNGNLYICFPMIITDHNFAAINIISLVTGCTFFARDMEDKRKKIISEFHNKQTLNIFKGVYDEAYVKDIVQELILKALTKALQVMEPRVLEELEFREKIAGKTGVFSQVTSGRNNRILDLSR